MMNIVFDAIFTPILSVGVNYTYALLVRFYVLFEAPHLIRMGDYCVAIPI